MLHDALLGGCNTAAEGRELAQVVPVTAMAFTALMAAVGQGLQCTTRMCGLPPAALHGAQVETPTDK